MFKVDLEKAKNQRPTCQHPLDQRKSKRTPEKHQLLLHWPCLCLCGSQQTMENSKWDGNTRPPYLSPEKPVCMSRSWSSNPFVTWCEESTHYKRPWYWEILKAGGEGDERGQDGWMASLTQWTWVSASSRNGEGQGSQVCCSLWGPKESDMTEWLNNINNSAWEIRHAMQIFKTYKEIFPTALLLTNVNK